MKSLSHLTFNSLKSEYNGDLSREAFRKDLQKIKLNKIGRSPTLTITDENQQGIMITGYRPYEALLEVVQQIPFLTG